MAVTFRILMAALLLLLPTAFGSATAGETREVRTDLFPAIFDKLRNDASLQSLWASCPADIYRKEAAFWSGAIDNPDVEVEQCEADPQACYAECFQARNENACFGLARAFQGNMQTRFSAYWEALFARACATGHDGACTNRGAGIRNGFYEDDPFTKKPEEVRNACLFRTFELTCREGDAWGCAMHGQSYQYGEGVMQDRAKAEAAYRKSCEIDPDFASCAYAKGQLEEMGISLQGK